MVRSDINPIPARASAPPGSPIPDTRALPDVGLSRPASIRKSVVFPAPFGPKRARHSPGARENVTPATARLGPNVRVSSVTSTIGGPADETVDSIRLELATLAREAQNAISLRRSRQFRDVTNSAPMTDIDVLLEETRKFEPPPEFRLTANVSSPDIYEQADRDPEKFWADRARELDWIRPWKKVLEWDPPHVKWYVGGKINAAANCIDRHIEGPRRNKAALIWEGEPGDQRTLTYWDLYCEVSKFANVLKKLGARKGDRIAIYLPLIPEAAIAMLACARIGAIHSVVFGGFSPESLRDRINDARAKILITADGGYRRGQIIPLKRNSDKALEETPSIEHVVVVQRRPGSGGDEAFADMKEGRDHWWHRLMRESPLKCEPEEMDAEDVMYILYTSGTK